MMRFAAVAVLAILGLVIYWLSDEDRLENVSVVFASLFSEERLVNQDRFQTAALAEVNHLRTQLGLSPLSTDPELDRALLHIAQSQQNPAQVDLNTLFNLLRDLFPGAQYLSATVVLDSKVSGLLSDLRSWEDASKEDYSSVATFLFKDGFQYGCLAVLTRRLPSFDLGAANREGGRFFNECPRCGKVHAIELGRTSQTLILSCPDCERPYDVLAADVLGEFRRAPDFLSGDFLPPSDGLAKSRDPVQRLRTIWAEVLEHCEYEYDTKSQKRGEAWKTPAQTWKDGAGDCEDTAILLADILISTGFDARVAVGWNVHIGQHAWTVARIGRDQYVLETTMRRNAGDALPELISVANAADEYQPEQLFDRSRLYFRENEEAGPRSCLDYWAESEWPAVELPAGAE